jgi:hypothetical protein
LPDGLQVELWVEREVASCGGHHRRRLATSSFLGEPVHLAFEGVNEDRWSEVAIVVRYPSPVGDGDDDSRVDGAVCGAEVLEDPSEPGHLVVIQDGSGARGRCPDDVFDAADRARERGAGPPGAGGSWCRRSDLGAAPRLRVRRADRFAGGRDPVAAKVEGRMLSMTVRTAPLRVGGTTANRRFSPRLEGDLALQIAWHARSMHALGMEVSVCIGVGQRRSIHHEHNLGGGLRSVG